jgi:hypothetical protein
MRKIKYYILPAMLFSSSCYHESEYLPTNVSSDQLIKSLAATAPAIPADAQSFTYIVAELPLDALDIRSVVVFTTTKGTFDNNSKTITLSATVVNDNGVNKRIAKAKLTSSAIIETADVTATVSNVSKTIPVSFTNLLFDSFLTIASFPASIPADGASFGYINIEQPLNILTDYTSIVFTTSNGLFDNGTKTITKSSATVLVNGVYKRVAQVRLIASKIVDSALVEVAVKGTSKNFTVNFLKALPDSVSISLSAPAIATGFANSVTITTSLIRSAGVPSLNNDATLTVTDTANVSRGSFINYSSKSDINGVIVNKFTLGSDTYKGKLIVTATAGTGKPSNTTQIIAQ